MLKIIMFFIVRFLNNLCLWADSSNWFIHNETNNYFKYPENFATDAMIHFKNNLVFRPLINTQIAKELSKKQGDTIDIKMPEYYIGNTGQNITGKTNTISQRTKQVQLKFWFNNSWQLSTLDRSITPDEFNEKTLKPGMEWIANQVDNICASRIKDLIWHCGTAGTTPNTFVQLTAGQLILDQIGVPSERVCVLDPAARWAYAHTFENMFVTEVSKNALMKGFLSRIADLEFFVSQNINTHTVGGTQSVPLTVSATLNKNSTLNQITMVGLDANLKEGDIFTIANVFAVNSWTKRVTTTTQHFVVTADVTAGGTADVVTFSPQIVMSDDIKLGFGPGRQNVDKYPVAGSTISFENTSHVCNGIFNKDAIALSFCPINPPLSLNYKQTVNHEGLSLTVGRGADILSYVETIRVDVLFACEAVYPEFGVRLMG